MIWQLWYGSDDGGFIDKENLGYDLPLNIKRISFDRQM